MVRFASTILLGRDMIDGDFERFLKNIYLPVERSIVTLKPFDGCAQVQDSKIVKFIHDTIERQRSKS